MTAAAQPETPRPPHADVIAFASPGNGRSGQTSIVANASWTLAAAGWRVLVLDWATTPPPVSAYLSPPVGQPTPGLALQSALGLLHRSADPPRQRLNRYEVPRRPDGFIDIVSAPTTDRYLPPHAPEGRETGSALRDHLRNTGYDYVLVDCPPQPGEAAQTALAYLCDSIVVCFRPGSGRVPEVGRMLRQIRHQRPDPPRLVAALTQIGSVHRQAAEHLRAVRDTLARIAATDADADADRLDLRLVQIPQHSYHERLAVLLDEGAVRDGLLDIVRLVSAGKVDAPPTIDPAVHAWYRRDFADISDDEVIGTIQLAYHPVDRRWADWIRAELLRCGARTEAVPADDGWLAGAEPGSLVVVGHRPLAEPRVTGLLRRPGAPAATTPHPTVLQVRIDEQAPASDAENQYLLDLSGQSEANARGRLLTHLGMRSRTDPPGPGAFQPRYPGNPDPVAGPDSPGPAWPLVDLPPGDDQFVGRARELELLRDHLLTHPGSPLAVVGPAGIGKTELVHAYARRFAGDYDVVWWIPAESRESIGAALSRLGDELRARTPEGSEPVGAGAVPADDLPPDARSALGVLCDRISPRPFLLVYDNVRSGDDLDTVPHSDLGHVLVIAQPDVLPADLPAQEVGPLHRRDGIALLKQHVPDMADDDAEAITEGVGHLPLALRLAGAWLQEQVDVLLREAPATALATVASAAALLRERLAEQGDAAPGAGLRWIWDMIRTNLHHTPTGFLAARLAELASHLSGDRIGLRLVRSSPMVATLRQAGGDDADRLGADPIEFDRMLWTGARFGVFDVTWGPDGALRMNSALQRAIRESLPEHERSARRTQVQLALAQFAPGILEDDDLEQRGRLAELQPHLLPCGAVTATEPVIRRWVVRQVRYMQLQQVSKISDAALAIAVDALAAWQADTPPDDPTLLWLRVEHANILRAQGHYERAHAIDEDVRRRQAGTQGEEHLRTLITTRGLGGDLRNLGRYEAARRHDSLAFHGFRRTLGGDHAHTLMAAHNFAFSSYLDGDVHTAMLTQRDILHRRIRLLGTANFRTWWTAESLGTYQRELGDLSAARDTLDTAYGWILGALGRTRWQHPVELRVRRGQAVTWRRLGQYRLALENSQELTAAYRRLLGDDHADTWACRLTLAADHHARGNSEVAVRQAREVLDRYESSAFGPDHPFTALCRMNVAIYLRATDRLAEARELGERAWRGLLAALSGETHPWALAAMINQAGHLVAVGERDAALGLARTAARWCRDDLPSRHPYLAAAEANIQVVESVHPGSESARLYYRDLDVDIPLM